MKENNCLRNHVIIYDDECPLCRAYTGAFVRMDFLEKEGRIPYKDIALLKNTNIDSGRSVNEIPLIDQVSGEVTYGIRSLLKILGHRWKLFNYLAKKPAFLYPVGKLYSFISYNRKVIMPGKDTESSCVPDFNVKYRILYLIFCSMVTGISLYYFAALLPARLRPGAAIVEIMIAAGQILFQLPFLSGKKRTTIYNYLGNLMTVSLAGALALIPVTLAGHYLSTGFPFTAVCFIVIAGGMFAEHYRRVRLLGLPAYLCLTWVLYRLLLLLILLLLP